MKPYLNVPFLPEDSYIDFLSQCIADLDSVHFSLLHNHAGLDSRIRIEPVISRNNMIRQLARLRGPRK
mgnify:CR=1 FL=1